MAWFVCILESPTSNTAGIKWREYVNTVQAENSEVQTKVLEKYFHL